MSEHSRRERVDRALLAKLIKAHRKRHGLGARDAAREVGYSAATISRVERGGGCDADTFVALAAWLGLDMVAFVTMTPASKRRRPAAQEPQP